jgi:ATP-dependent Clp protease ATP-binding subunit ClpC
MENKESEQFYTDKETNNWGINFRQRFLYFDLDLSPSFIRLNKSKRGFEKLIKIVSLILAISGFVSLIAWVFINRELIFNDVLTYILFWQHSDPLILWFLISLWFLLFYIYRYNQEKIKKNKVNYRKFKKDNIIKKGATFNVSKAFGEESMSIFEEAFLLANRLKQNEIKLIHFFRVLLKNREIQKSFVRLGVSARFLIEKLDRHLIFNKPEEFSDQVKWSLDVQKLAILSFQEAIKRKQNSILPLNLLSNCWSLDSLLSEILQDIKLTEDKLKNVVEWFFTNQKIYEKYSSWRQLAAFKPAGGMNRSYTAIATPTLDHFSHDLTLSAKNNRLDFCVNRQQELDNIFEVLASGQSGVLLVGQNGVGKKTIISGIAQLMVSEEVPDFLKDKRLVEIDVSRLVSGANPSVAQERMLACISEANSAGNIILSMNNVENIVGISAGSEQSLDLSEVLAESLSRGHIYCLATVTTSNYSKYIEGQALGEAMSVVGISEPDFNEAIQILESKIPFLESHYSVFFSYGAIEKSVKLSVKYLHDKFLPAKALDLLKLAASICSKEARKDPSKALCGSEHVALAVAELTGVPTQKISEDEGEKLLNLEENIHERMVGQEEAVKAVSASLRRARVSIKNSNKPIASFLFLGPTGVGKTELAKTVSEVYFSGEQYMIRIDMSEYQRPDSVRKLIGDVDGTLGYLTESVRKKPFSLVLFDEIEKAHPDILNLFLQMLDDGRLTDGQGRTISFSESIIIATSNIGAIYIQEEVKKNTKIKEIKQELIDNRLHKYMRPELINRFDGIIVFTPLSREHIFKIATLMLKGIKKNLTEKGINMQADRDGVLSLAKDGYDPKFGARPLRRLLQERVENIVANKLLAGEVARRDTVIINSQGKIEIEKADSL